MKNILLQPILIIFIAGACSHKSINISQDHRDSIVNSYLLTSDSFWFVNPQNPSLSLLNAYYNGDLDVLKSAHEDLIKELSYERIRKGFYEEVGIEKLKDLKYKEVYFFDYTASFCNKRTIIILGRDMDTFELQTTIVEFDDKDSLITVSSKNNIKITGQKWDSIISEINEADFWGLKYDNGKEGLDGSNLYIYAIIKPQNFYEGKFHSIYRWSPERYAIGKVFQNLLKLSNTNIDCYHW